MAEGMMGRGPARRGRLSDEQRAQIRQVRMEQGRGAARAMRRNLRREAGLPVMQRPMRQRSINELQDRMSEMGQAPQSPIVMGQPTGDMMAFRPMPTERPSMAPMSPGFGPGAAQGIGAALGGQANNPLRDQMLRFNEMSPETRARLIPSRENFFQNANVRDPGFQMNPEQMQAMRDQYTQVQNPMQQSVQPQFNANMPAMQPGMNTGINPMFDRARGLFAQKQAQNAMNPSFNPYLAGARFY